VVKRCGSQGQKCSATFLLSISARLPDAILFNHLNFYRMETKKSDSLPGQGYNLETLMEFYLLDKYHDFNMKLDIRINAMSDQMDQRLELLGKNSFAFLTASNPIGQILFPEENLKRYRELEHDLSGYETHHGEVKGDDDNCPASAGFFIFQITQERAIQLAIKYG